MDWIQFLKDAALLNLMHENRMQYLHSDVSYRQYNAQRIDLELKREELRQDVRNCAQNTRRRL
jgi:hypothetical protein